MSEEALQKFPRQLHERDLFNSDEYRELCNRSGQMMNRFWDAALYKGDQGLHDGICWNRPELDDTDWQTVDTFSKEWGRKNGYPVSGSHWFPSESECISGTSRKRCCPAFGMHGGCRFGICKRYLRR